MSSETWLKADNIAHRFFCKLALLVYAARSSTVESHKSDKWFNLETPDTDIFKDNLRIYRAISTLSPPIPPFELQVLLVVPDLATNQVLVLTDPSSARRTHVKPTPSHVLLESWLVVFAPSLSRAPPGTSASHSSLSSSEEVALSSVYKQSITLFRSLFTLLRILPAYKLTKRLKRAGADSSQLSIQVRVHTQPLPQPSRSESILRFGDAISPPSPISSPSPMPTRIQLSPTNISHSSSSHNPPSSTSPPATSLPTSTYTFPAVSHPLGALSIAVTYLLSPTFHIDTLESLLSSRFLSQSKDEESFMPTIAARQAQAQAQSGSLRGMNMNMNMGGGAAAMLSKSPPRPIPPSFRPSSTGFGSPSLVDRFILPPGGSVSSVRSTPSRPVSSLISGSAGSGHGETVPGAMLPSSSQAAAATSGVGPGPGTGVGASAVPIKRPSISVNPLINPFKSPTLSSTSAPHSLHSQYSPHPMHSQHSIHSSNFGVGVGAGQLTAAEQGRTLPSRPSSTLSSHQQHPFPSTTSTSQIPPSPSFRHPSGGSPSALGLGLGASSSPAGAGSAMGAGTTGSSPASVSSQHSLGPRKYVSSFSHRRQSTLGMIEKVESNLVAPGPSASSSSSAAGLAKEPSSSSSGTNTVAPAPHLSPNMAASSAQPLQEAEEDELSAFVQAIDDRVPLGSVRHRLKGGGGHPLREGSMRDGTDGQGDGAERIAGGRRESTSSLSPIEPVSLSASPHHHLNPRAQQLPSSPATQVHQTRNSPLARLPRSRAAIDAELNRMLDEFMTSLSTLNVNSNAQAGQAGNVGGGGGGGISAGANIIRRRTASGVTTSSRGSGSPSPGHGGPSPLAGALGLARRVSLAGGSPSGSVGSSSPSGSGSGLGFGLGLNSGSGTGSPLARSPPRGGHRPLYPPPPTSTPGSDLVNTSSPLLSSPPNANANTNTSLRAPHPYVYQYSSPPSHPHSHPHASTQPHQGSPLRAAIPLDSESSSSSPSPTTYRRVSASASGSGSGSGGSGSGSGDGDGSGELGYGIGIGMGGVVRGGGVPGHSPMRRILNRANASDEVIGRLDVEEVGSTGANPSGTSIASTGTGPGSAAIGIASGQNRTQSRGMGSRQVVYPFPSSGPGSGTNVGVGANAGVGSNGGEGITAKRGNGFRMY